MSTYILVADSGRARLFRVESRARDAPRKRELVEIAVLDNPAARQLLREQISDRSPRVFARARQGRQGPAGAAGASTGGESDMRVAEAERFAARIGRRLDLERRRLEMSGLVVIAAPRFLGRLRARLSAATRGIVQRELARDLVHATDAMILRAALTR